MYPKITGLLSGCSKNSMLDHHFPTNIASLVVASFFRQPLTSSPKHIPGEVKGREVVG